jgi:hypothetical protein
VSGGQEDDMTNLIRVLACLALAAGCGGCWGNNAQYLARTDTITPTAGNASETNEAIHVRDPWPRAAYNPNIPGNGSRMVGAVERYEGRQTRAPGQGAGQPGTAGGTATMPAIAPSSSSGVPPATLPY